MNWSANKPIKKRERFASPVAIAGLIGSGLLLLVMLYPEKSLLLLLSAPVVTTPAQQRYLEILVDMRAGDSNLVFTLARSYLAASLPGKAQLALEHLQGNLSPQKAKTALILNYEVRRQQLAAMRRGDPRLPAAQQQYAVQIDLLLKAGATAEELHRYLADATVIGDSATIDRLEKILNIQRSEKVIDGTSQSSVDKTVEASVLKSYDYRLVANQHFQNMLKASGYKKQKLFLAGVRTLQSGNLLNEAMTAADMYLKGLPDDRETLMYLSRLALAANRPERAQYYIRRALGLAETGKEG